MNLSMMKLGQRLAGPVSVSAWTKGSASDVVDYKISAPFREWCGFVKAKNQGVH